MKKNQVRIGETYTVDAFEPTKARCHGQLAPVRITGECPYGGWTGINTKTNREVRIRTAARLRGATERN